MNNFKPGDKVQLKSGGPIMVVQHIITNKNKVDVMCAWFPTVGSLPGFHVFAAEGLDPKPDFVPVAGN